MRTVLAIVAGLTLLALAPPPAHADTSQLLAFTRHRVGAIEIIVNESLQQPTVAVCSGTPEALPPLPPLLQRSLAARAAGLHSTRRSGGSIDCAELPRTELPMALWSVAQHLSLLERDSRGTAAPPLQGVGSPPEPLLPGERAARRVGGLLLAGAELLPVADGAPVAVVTVSGSVRAEEVLRLAEPLLSPLEAAAFRTYRLYQTTERLSVLKDARVAAPSFHLSWFAPKAESAALEAALAILGKGEASRLRRMLVLGRRSATGVEAWSTERFGSRLVGLSLSVSPHSTVDRVLRFVDGALKQLRLVGPTSAEVDRARALLQTEWLVGLESPLARAAALTECAVAEGNPSALAERLTAYSRLSPSAIREAAQLFLTPARRSVVEMYPLGHPEDDPALKGFDLYTVQSGDTWRSVAQRFGVDEWQLARDNDLDVKHGLSMGEALWIRPRDAKPSQPRSGPP